MKEIKIISVDVESGIVEVNFNNKKANITFWEDGEVDVESNEMSLEEIQELQMLACEDEKLRELFPFEE